MHGHTNIKFMRAIMSINGVGHDDDDGGSSVVVVAAMMQNAIKLCV